MWRVCSVLLLAISCLLLSHSVVDGRKGKATCKGDKWKVPVQVLSKDGFAVMCGTTKTRRHIASLSVEGHNRQCQGLTPDLFVQMNSCFWKPNCVIEYHRRAIGKNYMLKLFKGNESKCITKQPKKIYFRYQCTRKNVPILEAVEGRSKTVTKLNGIVRSHEDHPWMYKRKGNSYHRNLTLSKPSQTSEFFRYTIRNLKVADHDSLTVSWKEAGGIVDTKRFASDGNVTDYNDVINGAEDVTISLNVNKYTHGGEGFVLCFQWKESAVRGDVCADLIEPETCKKMRKRRKRN